jgi:hypothetical protein
MSEVRCEGAVLRGRGDASGIGFSVDHLPLYRMHRPSNQRESGIAKTLAPPYRIGGNVSPDAVQARLIGHEVLVVIAVPHLPTGCTSQMVNLAGGDEFEILDDGAQGCRDGILRS